MLRSIFVILLFSYVVILTNAYEYVKVGLIIRKDEEIIERIVNSVLSSKIGYGDDKSNIQVITETVDEEESVNYHQAFCNLLDKEIDALISSTVAPYYPVLCAYAREYQIPLITPDLPLEMSHFSTNYSFGIKPITSRPILKLFQQYGWNEIVYLYDHDDGPENLNFIFSVGKDVLNLTLGGIFRATTSGFANDYLQRLEKSSKNKLFHVVLDTDLELAEEILMYHVNDIHVGKKNFHFLYPRPALEEFWKYRKGSYGAINVTSFLIQNQVPEAEKVIRDAMKEPKIYWDILLYYYHDAALVLKNAIAAFNRHNLRRHRFTLERLLRKEPWHGHCMDENPKPRPIGHELSQIIAETAINGATGPIRFYHGKRNYFNINVTEITPQGFTRVAYWEDENLFPVPQKNMPTALPLIQTNGRLQIVSLVSPPYMMLKDEENGTILQGNDRFEGFCKDIIDYLAEEMKFQYDLHLIEDGTYGKYDKSRKRWTGIMGELIQGKADVAVTDLIITGQRQRVVEFTDPFEMVGFSLVMKNPRFVSRASHILFFLSAFTLDVWLCAIFTMIIFCVLFHYITKFTGAPDSIESASGIWGRKHTAIVNVWFALGSAMFQGTGVYPRSISSRILTGFCWFFTLILSSLFIASITAQILNSRLTDDTNPQLKQLRSLSLETIIAESVSRGWPKVGLVKPSNAYNFIKKSTIPTFTEFAKHLEDNPDVVVTSKDDGINRVRESAGNYVFLVESLSAEYAIRRKPCDIIATHDDITYASYGLATPLGSTLMKDLNKALLTVQSTGALGDLHRKWWLDSSECKTTVILDKEERTIHVVSGLLCMSAIGVLIVLGVFTFQYINRNQNKESRRQQLSFEDMNLGQPLPTPPPELLAEPPPVLNVPEYDQKTLL